MADNTSIEWCDHTFNPWEGCQKVSPGCDHCYAETRNARFNGTAVNWGPGAPRRRTSEANWKNPLKWNREAQAFFAAHGRRQRVFCASLADVFDNAVDPQWRRDLFALIDQTPNLDWLLLTKRIGNVPNMLPVPFDFAKLYQNVWLGITVVNQEEADRDIPKLLAIDASIRFLSMEPLLGPIRLEPEWLELLDWAILGGESGRDARPLYPGWARGPRDQCAAAGVPFLFKQWGEWAWAERYEGVPETLTAYKAGKKSAGRLLDGVEHNGFPHTNGELFSLATASPDYSGGALMTYRDHLARRGIQPVRIERTVKKPGDVVLQSWARPVVIVGGR